MTKSFSSFLARRFLKPKGIFMLIINVISVAGVTLGVGVMIVVLSVMKGFENEFRETLLGFDPHIMLNQVEFPPMDEKEESPEPLHPKIRDAVLNVPGVTGASPFVFGPVLTRFHGVMRLAIMKAIHPNDPQLKKLEESKMWDKSDPEAGELNLNPLITDEGGIIERGIISRSLADAYSEGFDMNMNRLPGLTVGDMITVRTGGELETLMKKLEENDALPQEERRPAKDLVDEYSGSKEILVAGIIDSPLYQNFVILPLEVGQNLYNLDSRGEVHGIGVYTQDPYHVVGVQHAIDALLPGNWDSVNWADSNRTRLNALTLERRLVSALLFCIVIVAAFCIMNTTIVTTVQKRREIGVLKAIGARTSQIVQVFLYQALMVGLIGTVSGVTIGLLVLHYLEPIREVLAHLGSDPFPIETYGLVKIPSEIIPLSIFLIAGIAIVACTLASLPPAWVVARLDAAKALRSD